MLEFTKMDTVTEEPKLATSILLDVLEGIRDTDDQVLLNVIGNLTARVEEALNNKTIQGNSRVLSVFEALQEKLKMADINGLKLIAKSYFEATKELA